jgi:TPR repeat protein
MNRCLAIALGLLLAVAPPLAPVATAAQTGQPIPRSYPAQSSERPDRNTPEDQRTREIAAADAADAACQAGTWAACATLGMAYETGAGRPQNRPVAELLYRRACDADDGEGCFRLGELLALTENAADRGFVELFIARACQLGSLEACNRMADHLGDGLIDPREPVAAARLRRATCDRGGRSACLVMAQALIEPDRSLSQQDEGRAVLDRQCRAGDPEACEIAAAQWQRLIAPDAAALLAEYRQIGCGAGSASLCSDLGVATMAGGSGAADRTNAIALFDRACALDRYRLSDCTNAAALREEPQLTARCDSGDHTACIALAEILLNYENVVADKQRGLAVLGRSCEAGASDACPKAAAQVFWHWEASGVAEPELAEFYLVKGCDRGNRDACKTLAYGLAKGGRLREDQPRAILLLNGLCDDGVIDACEALAKYAADDPAGPLMLALANFGPELTPEEEAEQSRKRQEDRDRERAEAEVDRCTTTSVVFDGQTHTDTVCAKTTVRVVGLGFPVRRGEAPWQALLWRPPVLGQDTYVPAQQVLCGGTVISEGWILTAAHCLTDQEYSIDKAGHRVRLGLSNPLSDEGFSYPILRAIPHPDYDREVLAFDIALVQFDTRRGTRGRTATPPARVRLDPLPLEQRKLEVLEPVMTYGWGVTKVGTGLIPDHLRGARLRLRDRTSCTNQTKFRDSKRRDSVVCADQSRAADGGQACDGDSGGPLISYGDIDKVPTVIGVVSGGKECGTADKPSRYIRVAHPKVRQWLAQYLPLSRMR